MAEIKILPNEKIRWIERMAADLRLTATQFRVGAMIGRHFNRGQRDTFVGREHLAKELGVSVRAVELAIGTLEALGYIERERVGGLGRGIGGRGNTNTYRMPLQTLGPRSDGRETPNSSAAPPEKTANEGSLFPGSAEAETANDASPFSGAERANVASQKGENFDAKGRTLLRPNPYREPFKKENPRPGESLASKPWFTPLGHALRSLAEHVEPPQARQEEKKPLPRFRDEKTFAKLAGLLCPEDAYRGWLVILELDERDRKTQSGHLVELARLTRTGRISENDLSAARLLARRAEPGADEALAKRGT